VSFNKINTFGWYNQRVYDLETAGHEVSDFSAALNLTQISDDRIPTGIYYRKESIPFHERISVLKEGPLISRPFDSRSLKHVIQNLT
jgi:2-oxoglutarate ferredoxin oxidoreductase subunit beta